MLRLAYALTGHQEREEYTMGKVSTAWVEDQARPWRYGLKESIREQIREDIEEVPHREVERAVGREAIDGARRFSTSSGYPG